MARRSNADVLEDVDLSAETDTAETPAESTDKPAKAKKEPKRGELAEGLVTPVQLAKILTERELHTDKNGGHEVKPQMVYSYIKNAPSDDPFPASTVTDSIGAERANVVSVEDGVAWWERKNARVAEKRASAQEKRDKKAERAAAKAAEASTEAEGEAVEAE